MPDWIGSALQVLGGATQTVLRWMTGYQKPSTEKSRMLKDDQEDIDRFNKQQAEGRIDEVRKDLGDDAPAS